MTARSRPIKVKSSIHLVLKQHHLSIHNTPEDNPQCPMLPEHFDETVWRMCSVFHHPVTLARCRHFSSNKNLSSGMF